MLQLNDQKRTHLAYMDSNLAFYNDIDLNQTEDYFKIKALKVLMGTIIVDPEGSKALSTEMILN